MMGAGLEAWARLWADAILQRAGFSSSFPTLYLLGPVCVRVHFCLRVHFCPRTHSCIQLHSCVHSFLLARGWVWGGRGKLIEVSSGPVGVGCLCDMVGWVFVLCDILWAL